MSPTDSAPPNNLCLVLCFALYQIKNFFMCDAKTFIILRSRWKWAPKEYQLSSASSPAGIFFSPLADIIWNYADGRRLSASLLSGVDNSKFVLIKSSEWKFFSNASPIKYFDKEAWEKLVNEINESRLLIDW